MALTTEEIEAIVRSYMSIQRVSEFVAVRGSSYAVELSEKELPLIRGIFLLGCLDFLAQTTNEGVTQQDVVNLLRSFLSDENIFPEGGSTSLLNAILDAPSDPTLAEDIMAYGAHGVLSTKVAGQNAFGLLLKDDARMDRIMSVLRDEPLDIADPEVEDENEPEKAPTLSPPTRAKVAPKKRAAATKKQQNTNKPSIQTPKKAKRKSPPVRSSAKKTNKPRWVEIAEKGPKKQAPKQKPRTPPRQPQTTVKHAPTRTRKAPASKTTKPRQEEIELDLVEPRTRGLFLVFGAVVVCAFVLVFVTGGPTEAYQSYLESGRGSCFTAAVGRSCISDTDDETNGMVFRVPDDPYYDLIVDGNYSAAIKNVSPAANRRDAVASNNLGLMLYRQMGLEKNLEVAFSLMKIAREYRPLTLSAHTYMVRIGQTRLTELGLYSGEIDGDLGPLTQRGIQEFINDHPRLFRETPDEFGYIDALEVVASY